MTVLHKRNYHCHRMDAYIINVLYALSSNRK
jgi:hypothetical protein